MQKTVTLAAGLLSLAVASGASANPQSGKMFDLFDSDKNGEITMAEYRNGGMDAEGTNWAQGLSTVCTEHTLKSVEPELVSSFKQMDADNNNSISRDEFLKNGQAIYNDYWQASFKEADTDKNGELSRGEFSQQAKSYIDSLKKSYADNKIPTECKADMEYWSSYYEGMSQYVDTAFGYLDQNGDSSLTYQEYTGTHLWK